MSRLLVVLMVLVPACQVALAGEKKAKESVAARAVAKLEARFSALRKQGTGLALRERYEALLAEASAVAERHAKDPASARAFLMVARCCEALGKHPEKATAFARYIDVVAKHAKERAVAELRSEVESLVDRRELFEAIKLLGLMLSKFPEGPEAAYALYRLGTCHLWMDHHEEATGPLGEVVERWPKSDIAVQARLRLARANFAENKHDDTISALETFLKQDRKCPERDALLYHLAVARCRSGDRYGGLVDFQRIVREAPKSPYARLALAELARVRSEILRRIGR